VPEFGSREAELDGLENRESGGNSRPNRTDKENYGNVVDEGRKVLVLGDGDQGALTGLGVRVHNRADSSGVA
jgi:hypothetical protein